MQEAQFCGQSQKDYWPTGNNGLKLYMRNEFLLYSISLAIHSCPTICNPMDCSIPGFHVHHQLLEHTQTHASRVGDAIQPSHPLSPLFLLPSIFPNIRVFSNESVLHIRWRNTEAPASASVVSVNIQDWSPLGLPGWISLQSKGLSRVFSNTTVQKHQFLMLSFLYGPTLISVHDYQKNHSFD